MLFCIKVSIFRQEFFVKNNICGVENNIFLCIVYKVITIILILNEYHQFRIQCKFIGTNFIGEKHIYPIYQSCKQ